MFQAAILITIQTKRMRNCLRTHTLYTNNYLLSLLFLFAIVQTIPAVLKSKRDSRRSRMQSFTGITNVFIAVENEKYHSPDLTWTTTSCNHSFVTVCFVSVCIVDDSINRVDTAHKYVSQLRSFVRDKTQHRGTNEERILINSNRIEIHRTKHSRSLSGMNCRFSARVVPTEPERGVTEWGHVTTIQWVKLRWWGGSGPINARFPFDVEGEGPGNFMKRTKSP